MEVQKSVPLSSSPQADVAAEALSSQHEHLLNEVEAAEGQLGAILRCVNNIGVGTRGATGALPPPLSVY